MFNPMLRWEPGELVHYHGSLTNLHGVYAVHRCGCSRHADERNGVHLQLVGDDGIVAVTCVRPRSVTPVIETSTLTTTV